MKAIILISALLVSGCDWGQSEPPMSAKEISEGIRYCTDRELKPVLFKDQGYGAIRRIDCGPVENTIWF